MFNRLQPRILRALALLAIGALPLLAAVKPRPVPAAAAHDSTTVHAATPVTPVSTITALTITTPLTLFYGQTVDGFAQVQGSDSSALSGTVTFFDGSTSFCTIPVIASANCPASAGTGFIAGQHSLTAAYSGDATHSGSTSPAVNVTIAPDTTTAVLVSSLPRSVMGQAITLTATLTGSFATPNGSVSFIDNTASGPINLGSAPLSSTGVATLSTFVLAAGMHSITATYTPTQNFNATVSLPITQVVTLPAPVATFVTLSSNANPAVTGQGVSLSANVATLTRSSYTPTGLVTFFDDNATLGTASLDSSGVATLTSSTLTTGTHTITASYTGDLASAASISPGFAQVVNPAGAPAPAAFSIGINSAADAGSIRLAPGASDDVTVTISPRNGFNQPVRLACAHLPAGASCSFASSTVSSGAGSTTLRLTTAAPRACGASSPYGQSSAVLPYSPLLAGVLIFLLPRRRRALKGLLAVFAMGGFIALTGCGACTDLGTKPGSYTIQVTGSSMGSAPVTVTQTIRVNVSE